MFLKKVFLLFDFLIDIMAYLVFLYSALIFAFAFAFIFPLSFYQVSLVTYLPNF